MRVTSMHVCLRVLGWRCVLSADPMLPGRCVRTAAAAIRASGASPRPDSPACAQPGSNLTALALEAAAAAGLGERAHALGACAPGAGAAPASAGALQALLAHAPQASGTQVNARHTRPQSGLLMLPWGAAGRQAGARTSAASARRDGVPVRDGLRGCCVAECRIQLQVMLRSQRGPDGVCMRQVAGDDRERLALTPRPAAAAQAVVVCAGAADAAQEAALVGGLAAAARADGRRSVFLYASQPPAQVRPRAGPEEPPERVVARWGSWGCAPGHSLLVLSAICSSRSCSQSGRQGVGFKWAPRMLSH